MITRRGLHSFSSSRLFITLLTPVIVGLTGVFLQSSWPSGRALAPASPEQIRQRLFDELQPVTLANCELQRFGEPHDGGYLMCGNLLDAVASAYSYGISGYDGWGCDVSRRFGVPVHQYDCFDTTRPVCPSGQMIFHPVCVAGEPRVVDGRVFGTLEQQIGENGDAGKRLAVKMDIEGSEWETLERAPDELLQRIDQLAIEFHGVDEPRILRLVERLKRQFHVVHRHFNNYSCVDTLGPFPAWAYEILFVSRRLGVVDPAAAPALPHVLDAPNDPGADDCQAAYSPTAPLNPER